LAVTCAFLWSIDEILRETRVVEQIKRSANDRTDQLSYQTTRALNGGYNVGTELMMVIGTG
jgi:hypothetical protein